MNGGTAASPVYLVVENGNPNSITRSGHGHIISENEYNKLKWLIGTNMGIYIFPLGKGTSDYMPFYLNKTTAGACPSPPCSYEVSSYYTLHNTVLPSGVTNMNPGESSAIDRFWVIGQAGYTSNPVSNIRFYYINNATELGGIPEVNLKAQRWASSKWQPPVGTVDLTNHYVEVAGVSQFSPWTLVDLNNPLPITLLSFTGEGENSKQASALLKWSTSTEISNDYFELQRSNNTIAFREIGTVKGAGNSTTIHNYTFSDADLSRSDTILYYRLKQVDFNGKTSYSNIVELKRGARENSFVSIFPNPTYGLTNISFSIPEDRSSFVEIINTLGQVLLQKKIVIKSGIFNYPIDLSSLADGVYSIRISTNNYTEVQKIVINK